MALELWIFLALAAVAGLLVAVAWLRKKRRPPATQGENNVYPLW